MPDPEVTGANEPITQPLPLQELPRQARIDGEIAVVRAHHARIAEAIQVLWGHRDCEKYLQQLIINGGDGVMRTREGFKSEVVSALINLAALHETE